MASSFTVYWPHSANYAANSLLLGWRHGSDTVVVTGASERCVSRHGGPAPAAAAEQHEIVGRVAGDNSSGQTFVIDKGPAGSGAGSWILVQQQFLEPRGESSSILLIGLEAAGRSTVDGDSRLRVPRLTVVLDRHGESASPGAVRVVLYRQCLLERLFPLYVAEVDDLPSAPSSSNEAAAPYYLRLCDLLNTPASDCNGMENTGMRPPPRSGAPSSAADSASHCYSPATAPHDEGGGNGARGQGAGPAATTPDPLPSPLAVTAGVVGSRGGAFGFAAPSLAPLLRRRRHAADAAPANPPPSHQGQPMRPLLALGFICWALSVCLLMVASTTRALARWIARLNNMMTRIVGAASSLLPGLVLTQLRHKMEALDLVTTSLARRLHGGPAPQSVERTIQLIDAGAGLLLDSLLGVLALLLLQRMLLQRMLLQPPPQQEQQQQPPAVAVLQWLTLHGPFGSIRPTALRSWVDWLMGLPIGLKLNHQLNKIAGGALLTAIDVWELTVLGLGAALSSAPSPWGPAPPNWYHAATHYLPLLGAAAGGLSLMLSVAHDVFYLATLHVRTLRALLTYCHGQQLHLLWSLSLLFRGRKYNVLRGRTDSAEFSMAQLLFGTMLFGTLSFLFPTALVYHIYFSALFALVEAALAAASAAVSVLNTLPLCAVAAALTGHTHAGMTLVLLTTDEECVERRVPRSVVTPRTAASIAAEAAGPQGGLLAPRAPPLREMEVVRAATGDGGWRVASSSGAVGASAAGHNAAASFSGLPRHSYYDLVPRRTGAGEVVRLAARGLAVRLQAIPAQRMLWELLAGSPPASKQ